MPLLYTTLNKLQEQGFVAEVEKIISDANRVRIYYCITETGRRYLSELKTLYKGIIRYRQIHRFKRKTIKGPHHMEIREIEIYLEQVRNSIF